MSDWEDIFGAGVSAESVIDKINASWEHTYAAEQTGEGERRQRKAHLTAYSGSERQKETFIRHLRNNISRITDAPWNKVLSTLMHPSEDEILDLEKKHCIPPHLSHLIKDISVGLRRETYHPNRKKDMEAAADWLIGCFEAIKPGVDLRLVAPKFAALITRDALRLERASYLDICCDQKTVRSACASAVEVVYARARGVYVQDRLANAASQSAWNSVHDQFKSGDYGSGSIEDFRAAIIGSAAAIKPDSGSEAAEYMVLARYECCEYGEADQSRYWEDYAKIMLDMLASAPVERMKIIDLNRVEHLLLSGG